MNTCLTDEAIEETLGDFLPCAVPVSGANFAERMEGLCSCSTCYQRQHERSAVLD